MSFMGKRYPLYPVRGDRCRYWAFQGISLMTQSGIYPLRMAALNEKGDIIRAQKSVQVAVIPYLKERIQIVPKKRHLLTSQALKEEGKLLGSLFSKRKASKRWSGKFLLPVHGRHTSAFGIQRIYNNGRASWQHKGIDIAAEEGTKIVAPNAGKIVLASTLVAHGNTLVIDHGQGIFSVMIHMKDFAVKKGQTVRKGDLIGTIGKTGMANAPHLHWGLSVGNVRVSPMEWTEKSMDRLIQ